MSDIQEAIRHFEILNKNYNPVSGPNILQLAIDALRAQQAREKLDYKSLDTVKKILEGKRIVSITVNQSVGPDLAANGHYTTYKRIGNPYIIIEYERKETDHE